jgi:two-component system response regulator FixJ
MPGLSGLDLQNELKRRGNPVPLILITGHGDIAMAVTAIKAGAFDFIEKPFDNNTLLNSISRAIESGERARTEQDEIASVLTRMAELSLRQRQVMELVVQGLSNKQIALRLAISPRTVENYRAWVMEKMGASNLADLVRIVVRLEASGARPAAAPTEQ